MDNNPLRGKKILITRARDQAGQFSTLLRKLGAEVIEFPTIEVVPPLRWEELDRAISRLDSYDWIIFTSANGVKFFWERLKEKGKEDPFPFRLKICAIGPATAKQLKEKGVRIDYVPKEYIAEAILGGFERMAIQGKHILLARARVARDVLPRGLRKAGARVDVVETYRTIKPRGGAKKLRQLLSVGEIDTVTFTSSSTVNHFMELLKKEDWKMLLNGVAIACIGPVTASTAKEWGMSVHIQPEAYTIPAMTEAIARYFNHVNHNNGKIAKI